MNLSPAVARFRALARPVAVFALLFRLVESALLVPLAALAASWISGAEVIDSTALISFALTPRGLAYLVLAAGVPILIRLLEHAGLTVLCWDAVAGQPVRARHAARAVIQTFPDLLRLAGIILGTGLILLLPVAVVAGWLASRLLPLYDINYYLALRPPEFLWAVAAILAAGALSVTAGLIVAVRWRLAVQAMMIEALPAGAALRRSARLVHHAFLPTAGRCVAVILVALVLAASASFAGDLLTTRLLGWVGTTPVSIAVTLGTLAALRTLCAISLTIFSVTLDAKVFTRWYRVRRRALDQTELPCAAARSETVHAHEPLHPVLPMVAAVMILGVSISSGVSGLASLPSPDLPQITAHRGVTTRFAENTLGAVEDAVASGADLVEVDVQMSRDGVLVVAHDSDFSRFGALPDKVWMMDYAEIRRLPLRPLGQPDAAAASAPMLSEVLEAVRGRIGINIELKYYGTHQPQLATRVVEELRRRNLPDRVLIQSLSYEGLQESRRAGPEFPVGYLMSVNSRHPERLDVDFLSVESRRIDAAFVRRAHRRDLEVHAWTVNSAAEARRLIDLGVDNFITDRPELMREILQETAQRSEAEQLLRRLRAILLH